MPEEIFDILFTFEKSIRYHQRRRAFYDSWRRWLSLAVIVIGSTFVTDILSDHPNFIKLLALLIVICGASDLVFGLADRARDHEFLMRRFADLMAQVRHCSAPTEDDLRIWCAKRVEIEADEPATYWALEAACYNETTRAFGRNRSDEVRIPWYYRLLKNYVRFDPTHFKPAGE